jgi:hypothetical protein
VASPLEWPGVHCAQAILSEAPLEGVWFDRTREGVARRRGEDVGPRDFAETEVLEWNPLPCWAHLSREEYVKRVREAVEQIESDTAARIWETGIAPRPAQPLQEVPRSPLPRLSEVRPPGNVGGLRPLRRRLPGSGRAPQERPPSSRVPRGKLPARRTVRGHPAPGGIATVAPLRPKTPPPLPGLGRSGELRPGDRIPSLRRALRVVSVPLRWPEGRQFNGSSGFRLAVRGQGGSTGPLIANPLQNSPGTLICQFRGCSGSRPADRGQGGSSGPLIANPLQNSPGTLIGTLIAAGIPAVPSTAEPSALSQPLR